MFETLLHNVNKYQHRAIDLLLREFLLGLYLLPDSESMLQEVDFKQFMQGLAPVSRCLQLIDVADLELSTGLNSTFQMVLRNNVC